MGNKAIIATEKRDLAVYLHWNGGIDSVEAFLDYCRMQDFRCPTRDPEYGFCRLAQVVANYMGPGGLSAGVCRYTNDEDINPGDNGIYFIKDWKIQSWVQHGEEILPPWGPELREGYSRHEMLLDIDEAQPTSMSIRPLIEATEIPVEKLSIGDTVWIRKFGGELEAHAVVGIGEKGKIVNGHDASGVPYVDLYGGKRCSENPNNYLFPKCGEKTRNVFADIAGR